MAFRMRHLLQLCWNRAVQSQWFMTFVLFEGDIKRFKISQEIIYWKDLEAPLELHMDFIPNFFRRIGKKLKKIFLFRYLFLHKSQSNENLSKGTKKANFYQVPTTRDSRVENYVINILGWLIQEDKQTIYRFFYKIWYNNKFNSKQTVEVS